jgi:trans-aconitate 2-methyltransferase
MRAIFLFISQAVFCTNGHAARPARRRFARRLPASHELHQDLPVLVLLARRFPLESADSRATLCPDGPNTGELRSDIPLPDPARAEALSQVQTVKYSPSMREWNADSYHQVSAPQVEWGREVLERLPLAGDELVLDVGCGTGRLTEKLLERLPGGRVVAIDLSANMLQVARDFLRPRFGGRVQLVRADASDLPVSCMADAVFSTATFHWVRDHVRLFRSLHTALKPGGRLVAQCGGGPNIARLHGRADALMREPPFAPYFSSWQEPWEFPDAATAARRLREAAFENVRTSLVSLPAVQPDARSFRTFITTVICGPHLAYLDKPALQDAFIARLTELAAADDPPFELDYWRLNLDARKPSKIHDL